MSIREGEGTMNGINDEDYHPMELIHIGADGDRDLELEFGCTTCGITEKISLFDINVCISWIKSSSWNLLSAINKLEKSNIQDSILSLFKIEKMIGYIVIHFLLLIFFLKYGRESITSWQNNFCLFAVIRSSEVAWNIFSALLGWSDWNVRCKPPCIYWIPSNHWFALKESRPLSIHFSISNFFSSQFSLFQNTWNPL